MGLFHFSLGWGRRVGTDPGDTEVLLSFHTSQQKKALAPVDVSYEPGSGYNMGMTFAFAVTAL